MTRVLFLFNKGHGSMSITTFLVVLLLQFQGALTLFLTRVSVPAFHFVKEEARLDCDFDMEGDTLYSVKWYKNGLEFYRFVPIEKPKLQVFPQHGIVVDKHQSDRGNVVLRNVTLATSGYYKCEVSGEGPNFRTKSEGHDMIAVVPPKKTEIIGTAPKYSVGDLVNVTCYSHKSKPPAFLVWRVNDREVNPSPESFADFHYRLKAELREYRPILERNELETSALGLSFQVKPEHLNPIGLKLECAASIGSIHWQSIQEKIQVVPRETLGTTSWWSTSGAQRNVLGLFHQKLLISALLLTICQKLLF